MKRGQARLILTARSFACRPIASLEHQEFRTERTYKPATKLILDSTNDKGSFGSQTLGYWVVPTATVEWPKLACNLLPG